MAAASVPHVVIVGGGFGGLNAAKALDGAPVRVTLVDRRNHHLFQPLLYQVATAALDPSDVAEPIRRVLRHQANCTVLLADVRSIDPAGKRLVLGDGELSYDHLILATGATHAYFGHDDWAEHAPGLKSIEDALEIRRRVLLAYEAAEREPNLERRREWLSFVVVGAGPTGVELAGSLSEISRQVLRSDFRSAAHEGARVVLVEAGPRVLPTFSEASSAKALADLRRLGVEVRLDTRVTGIDGHGVDTSVGRIPARVTLWAAGVAASPLAKSLGVPLDRAGRVIVNPDLSVPGHPELFVVGDLAAATFEGQPVPGVAPAAMQGGRHAAAQVLRRVKGEQTEPFAYFDKGSMATIGRAKAVLESGAVKMSGFPAWAAWLFVHILYLVGFRNRLSVVASWAWTYFTFERQSRLITGAIPTLVEQPAAKPSLDAPAATPARVG